MKITWHPQWFQWIKIIKCLIFNNEYFNIKMALFYQYEDNLTPQWFQWIKIIKCLIFNNEYFNIKMALLFYQYEDNLTSPVVSIKKAKLSVSSENEVNSNSVWIRTILSPWAQAVKVWCWNLFCKCIKLCQFICDFKWNGG